MALCNSISSLGVKRFFLTQKYFWLSLHLVENYVKNVDELGSEHHVQAHINEPPCFFLTKRSDVHAVQKLLTVVSHVKKARWKFLLKQIVSLISQTTWPFSSTAHEWKLLFLQLEQLLINISKVNKIAKTALGPIILFFEFRKV